MSRPSWPLSVPDATSTCRRTRLSLEQRRPSQEKPTQQPAQTKVDVKARAALLSSCKSKSHTRADWESSLLKGCNSRRPGARPRRTPYSPEPSPPETNGGALTVERCVRSLRRHGNNVLLCRPRQPGEAHRNDAREWRTSGLRLPMY